MPAGMVNPFSKGPAPRGKPPSMNPKELFKFYMMIGAFVVVLASMLGFYLFSQDENNHPKKDKQGNIKIRDPHRAPPGRADKDPEGKPEDREPEPPPPDIKPEEKDPEKKDTAGMQDDGDIAAALEEFKVEQLETPIEKESRAFITVMTHLLRNVTPEEVTKQVNRTLTTRDLFDAADRHRGQYTRIFGRLIQLYPEYINATTPTGTKVVYLGILESFQPPHPNRTIYFYLPDYPKDPKTGKKIQFQTYSRGGYEYINDHVYIEGMFLRLLTYETINPKNDGIAKNTAAVVFVKNIQIAKPPEPPDHRVGFILVVGGAAVALIFVVILAGVMSKKYAKGTIHMRMYEARKKRAEGRGEKVLPDASSEKQILGDEVPKTPDHESQTTDHGPQSTDSGS